MAQKKALKNDYKPCSKALLKVGDAIGERKMSPMTEAEREEVREYFTTMKLTTDEQPSEKLEQASETLVGKSDRTDDARKADSLKARDDGEDDEDDDAMDFDYDDDDDDDNSDYDEFDEFDWMEQILGAVYLKDSDNEKKPERVGHCTSDLIRRGKIHENFYQEIEEPTLETATMGFELSDRYGRLKATYKNHPIKSGSGIWGDELDYGDILLIDGISINDKYRRKGLGQKLVRMVLEKALTKANPEWFTAMARTTAASQPLEAECKGKTDEEKRAIYDREEGIAASFLRSLGFRRISWTDWFALAGNTQHPCYSLAADQDFDPPKLSTPTIFDSLIEKLHFIEPGKNRLQAIQEIFGSYQDSDEIWKSTDMAGNTLLHHVVKFESPECVSWIMTKWPELAKVHNLYGETPLERCKEYLEEIRIQRPAWMMTLPMSDTFAGYSEKYTTIMASLKGLENPSKDEWLRLKYGCTCGQCQFGFISPRMHFALLVTAEIKHDYLEFQVEDSEMFMEYSGE
ncbi:hypothetical protein AA313_de0201772 [Arthrobotrys entomopaga]|nr:hypothetical protein AA313_de0201772 [Arthrobotrys entomopaga]